MEDKKELNNEEMVEENKAFLYFFSLQTSRLVYTIDDRSFIIVAHDLIRYILSAYIEFKIGSKTMRVLEKFRRRKDEPLSFKDNLTLAKEYNLIDRTLARELGDINTVRNWFAHDFRFIIFEDLKDLKKNPLMRYENEYRKDYEDFIKNWMKLKDTPTEDPKYSREYKYYVIALALKVSTNVFDVPLKILEERILKEFPNQKLKTADLNVLKSEPTNSQSE